MTKLLNGKLSFVKYELPVMILLFGQAIYNLIPFDGVGNLLQLYYLIDYSMSKTSRLFVGSLVRLINENPSKEWINGFALTVLTITLILVSLLVGGVIRNTDKELRPTLYVFIAFLVTGSFAMENFSKFLGVLDIWMFLAALLAVICAYNKHLRWLVPVICAVGGFIHNGFAITYFPLVILIVFYLMVTSEKKVANAIIFALSSAVAVILTIWVSVEGFKTTTVTQNELIEILKKRCGDNYNSGAAEYISFYLLDIVPEHASFGSEAIENTTIIERFFLMSSYALNKNPSNAYIVASVVMTLTIFPAFWAIWIKCMKNTDDKSRRFVYFCFLAFTFFVPLGFFLIEDYVRWIQAGMLTQLGVVFFMYFIKDEPFMKTMQQAKSFFADKAYIIIFVLIAYASSYQFELTL